MTLPCPALSGLPRSHFGAILVDPPWSFALRSMRSTSKSAHRHYPCMPLADIQAMPVADVAARDCALVMWTTAPFLQHAMATLASWGFTYKSAGAWAKQSPTGSAWQMGTGYTFRSAAEFYLLGTRGAPRRLSASVRNLVVAPIREHSRKPDQLRADVEAMYAGPFLEIFAREPAPGWTAWGNETTKFGAAPSEVRAASLRRTASAALPDGAGA